MFEFVGIVAVVSVGVNVYILVGRLFGPAFRSLESASRGYDEID